MTRVPLPELLERRRAFCYLSALDDPLAAAVRLAGLIDAYELSVPVAVASPCASSATLPC